MKSKILFRVAVLVIFLGLGLSGRLKADGYPLPLQNAGTWGTSPAALVADIQRALKDSKFLDAVAVARTLADGIAQGKVPATGASTQLPGVSAVSDAASQTVIITITDPSLLASPSFWSLTLEKQ